MSALGKLNCVLRCMGIVLVKTIDNEGKVPTRYRLMRWSSYWKKCNP